MTTIALPARNEIRNNAATVLAFAAGMIALPFVFGNGYYLNTLVFVAILALPALGLSLLSGLSGQLAISHGAFFALGAYGSSILAVRLGIDPAISTILAQFIVAAIAAAIGAVVLRLRSHYLAIATLSFAIIVELLIEEWSSVTGGMQGMIGIPPYEIAGMSLTSDKAVYLVYWPITILMLWFALNLSVSRVGRALRAIREGEPIVDSLGIRAANYKIGVYVVSSVFAGLGGSLYAHFVGFVTPATGSLMFAIDIIMVLALGGFDRLWGALVGVALITLLNEYALGFADYKRIFLGVALIAVMLVFPRGLLPGIIDLVGSGLRKGGADARRA
ncbi:branched-chain amino acid ABC transporter permease [Hoeflea sp. WL0058]|uniref:Branched-chain amino acid ABC transporter permease n=1 Tax=Flavimaribacter sediminis TaxID=2865987 RepID=A0AAE2ZJL3_9HYPH|nr:branched-chain amino acid ABC transporter permease [Flavimaribacter sediminis]MBW8636241.1 branched-chain amino acid ABC transporter permease [Flavimaribacter sediminis]